MLNSAYESHLNLICIMRRERSQSQKVTSCIIPFLWLADNVKLWRWRTDQWLLRVELEFGFGYKEAAWGNFFKGEVNCSVAFPSGSAVKNLPAMQETWVPSLVRKIPWKRSWLPTTVFLPGEFHGQRSYKESDMTEVTEHEHSSVFQLWW